MTDDLRYAIADAWTGWLRPVLIILAVAALAATYLLGWLAEPAYARLLAATVGALAGLGPGIAGALLARSRLAAVASFAIGLVWAAAYVAPTWRLVTPGEPTVVGTIAQGESLTLPAAPDGGVTLLVTADSLLLGGDKSGTKRGGAKKDSASSVRYDLKVTDDADRTVRVRGELSRKTVGGQRGGLPDPNAKRTVLHAADLHTTAWPAGAPLRVHAVTVKPKKSGALTVTVLPWAFPWLWAAILAALALVGAVVIDSRFVPARDRSFLPHAGGIALAFLLLIRDSLAPMAPVKPLFGTLLVAGAVGAVGGALLGVIGRKLFGKEEPRRIPAP